MTSYLNRYLLLSASLVQEDGLYEGKVVVKSKNSQFKVTVPYKANVLKGRLSPHEDCNQFHLSEPHDLEYSRFVRPEEKIQLEKAVTLKDKLFSRNLTFVNEFKVAVAVHKVTFEPKALEYFDVGDFKAQVVKPGAKVDLVNLKLTEKAWEERMLDSIVTLHTNVSAMTVPLLAYHGRVDPVISSLALVYALRCL